VRILGVALLLLLPRIAAAQESETQPLQELFLTETVYPQERGELQFTFGTRIDRASREQSSLLPFSVEYGITDRWQIEGGWDGYSPAHSLPFQDLRSARFSIGTKYSFMNIARSRVHASIGTDLEFSNAAAFRDGEGEQAGVEIEPVLALAIDLPFHVTVFGSGAASFAPQEVTDVLQDRGTISVGALVVVRRATFAAEYTNRSDSLPWQLDGSALLTPSIVVHPPAKWELGVGFPVGLRGRHQAGVAINIIKEFN